MIQVRNPRTGVADYAIAPPDATEIAHCCDRLRQAQTEWQASGLDNRIAAIQHWKGAIAERKTQLLEALVQDTGRLAVSVLEVDSFLNTLDRWCRLAPDLLKEFEKETAIPFIKLKQASVPYPLVGIISPWNFPLLLSTIDLVPALLAGCAVVVKPSEITPRFVQPLMAAIATVPGLRDCLQYLNGAGETGAMLIQQVDAVCFTGSVPTGRKVAAAAAERLIPAFLELGGKDPAIVLESANLDLATSAILWGAVVNTGQSCLSIERIYVAESIYEAFVAQLVTKAQALALAYPDLDSGPIGPIIAERQAAILQEQLLDALRQGAIARCGGAIETLGGGLWCRPTVLTGVHHGMKVMTEETFGPLMPVMPFRSTADAIALANDSPYGLSAAVFAGTEAAALAVGRQLQAGAISINDAALTALIYEGEKNSFKCSGLGGSRMGASAIQRFLRQQAFLIKTAAVADPWWFSA